LRFGCSRQWSGPPGVFAFNLDVVSTAARNCAGVCDGWRRVGRDDSTARRAIDHQPVRLACGVCFARLSRLLARISAQLAVCTRTRANSPRRHAGHAFWLVVPGRLALVYLLDHRAHAVREFDQREWSNYAPGGVTDGSRDHCEDGSALRIIA